MELPESNFGFLLHDVARLMRKRFEQNARGLKLTRSQCSVLAHLSRHEGIQQGGLAEILEVEPITGVAEAERDRLFAILSAMKANLLTKAATGASAERRASHG